MSLNLRIYSAFYPQTISLFERIIVTLFNHDRCSIDNCIFMLDVRMSYAMALPERTLSANEFLDSCFYIPGTVPSIQMSFVSLFLSF